MAAGNILLYASDGSMSAHIIEAVTRGPYIHCEVDAGDGTAVGAYSGSVHQHPLVTPAARVSVPGLVDLAAGMAWLAAQVKAHDEYGWIDILDALPGLPVLLLDPDGYDCSHLCASFLIHAGGSAWLGSLADMPEKASPNDLARCAGLLSREPTRQVGGGAAEAL